MTNKPEPTSTPGQPVMYHIKVKGHLGPQWADWFEGLALTLQEDGCTLLSGPVADQAALYGLLKTIRDLGLPLISVCQVDPGQEGPAQSDAANFAEPGG